LEQLSASLHCGGLTAVATALASTLATHLGCERVSVGVVQHRRMQVVGLSHSARFERRSNLIRAIGCAMDEALDQDATVSFDRNGYDSDAANLLHRQLAERFHSGGAHTVLLRHAERPVGAITIETPIASVLAPEKLLQCENIAALCAPTLALLREREHSWLRWLRPKIKTAQLTNNTQSRHRRKWILLAAATALLAFSATSGTYRITAQATLEGEVQRVISAPVDGYLAQVHARAGDNVSAGSPMATLDDRELRLEEIKWSSERQQLLREYREALANHDRAEASILRARLQKAEAQLELVQAQLDRLSITAPFDGIVLQGDLHQALGSALQRGDVLFKVAPRGDLRLVLQVDESEIARTTMGQRGVLTLASLPNTPVDFEVTLITPVSSPEDGRNYFRVEARLLDVLDQMRPGMRGVAKINAGDRRRFWIWTHNMMERLRLWSWSILP
jgi:multidrug resistance efflux pump